MAGYQSYQKSGYPRHDTFIRRRQKGNSATLEDLMELRIPEFVESWTPGTRVTARQVQCAIGPSPYTITYKDKEPDLHVEFYYGTKRVYARLQYVGGPHQSYEVRSLRWAAP